MLNNNMRGISYLSLAAFESLKEFAESHTFEERASQDVQFINDKGDIYIPYSKKYGPVESGANALPMFNPGGDVNARLVEMISFQSFRSTYMDNNVTTVNFNETISLATLLKQLSSDSSTYGVVLQAGEGRNSFAMNPLHPMVAFMVVSGLYTLPTSGKLHIFEYSASGKRRSIISSDAGKAKVKSYIDDYEKFFSLSGDIIRNPVTVKQVASISDITLDNISDSPFVENLMDVDITINKTTSEHNDISSIQSIVIPNQLIVDGTLSPYYGISNITEPSTSSMRGCSLSPMATGNINRRSSNGTLYKGAITSGGTANVCTGSENAGSPRGWFTLSRVNLGSMHFDSVVDLEEVFPFIKASKDISNGIWAVVEEKQKAASGSEASTSEETSAEPVSA